LLKVDPTRWSQTAHDLLLLSTNAPHARSRQRFLALWLILTGQNATQVAAHIQRQDQTVHDWVHLYNNEGPDALHYRRTGGRPPFAKTSPTP
jgi:transposase